MPRIRAASLAEHRSQTRGDILRAAAEVFSEFGYSEASLGDVAAVVGIGRTTMYEYFADKEDLLVVLVEQSVPGVIDGLVDSIPVRLSHSERLAELILRSLEFVADEANLGALIMREVPKLTSESQDRVAKAHRRLHDEIVAICRAGISAGEFRMVDPERVADLVGGATDVTSRRLIRAAEPKQQLHRLADDLITLLFDGLLVDGRRR